MSETYLTHNIYLVSADVWVLIIEFPEGDINDKLSLLASEKGLIYKSFYEDFIVGTCLVSSGPFFYHIRKRPELMTKFADIRKEILSFVYQYSPGFKPENIYINQNNILKTETSVREGEVVRRLVDNDLWNQDPPLSNFGPVVITSAPNKDIENPFLDEENTDLNEILDSSFDFGDGSNDLGIPYELVGHHWTQVGLYINIRKYENTQDNLIALIGGSPFENAEGYHILMAERCIEDYADVLQLLDNMGVSKTISPPQILENLYNIAITYNPFLKLEDVDLKEIRKLYKNTSNTKGSRKIAQAGAESKNNQPVQKKKFADITKVELRKLREEMKKRIVGQDEAVNNLVDAVHRAWIGLKREHEPNGVFLFTGSTGSGKTETVKALAQCLDAHLVRIDCQDYQQPHEVAKLAGSPAGYVGHEEGGHLTKEVVKYPFSVILLDEIEKANSAFHERILQIIDDGVMTDNKGAKVSFKDTIIVMTSNIGVKEVESISKTVGFGAVAVETSQNSTSARKEALKRKFKPEFINRVDEIINFRKLEKEDYLHILEILLAEVAQQIKKSRAITLKFKADAKEFLLDRGIDQKFGARPLRRAVKKYVNTSLARAILEEEIKDNSTVQVALSETKDGLIFKNNTKSKKAEA